MDRLDSQSAALPLASPGIHRAAPSHQRSVQNPQRRQSCRPIALPHRSLIRIVCKHHFEIQGGWALSHHSKDPNRLKQIQKVIYKKSEPKGLENGGKRSWNFYFTPVLVAIWWFLWRCGNWAHKTSAQSFSALEAWSHRPGASSPGRWRRKCNTAPGCRSDSWPPPPALRSTKFLTWPGRYQWYRVRPEYKTR